MYDDAILDALVGRLLDGPPLGSIMQARVFVLERFNWGILSGTPDAKLFDELVEAAVVRAARRIVAMGLSPQETYSRLVKLYDCQPALNVRSSTSVSQQAYSTPVPIAYIAGIAAGIQPEDTVYEPSAGHGALLLTANPNQVVANELNPERADDLRAQGYLVQEGDATRSIPSHGFDVMLMNPPFGAVPSAEGDGSQRFLVGRYTTTQIDHAIALKNLRKLKADGRAVLILGGVLGKDEERRSHRYHGQEKRAFYHSLYSQYRVTQHISIWGDLYRKQGAGFPIDLIVIEGQGQSERSLPAADLPRLYRSFDELGEFLDEVLRGQGGQEQGQSDGRAGRVDAGGDSNAVLGQGSGEQYGDSRLGDVSESVAAADTTPNSLLATGERPQLSGDTPVADVPLSTPSTDSSSFRTEPIHLERRLGGVLGNAERSDSDLAGVARSQFSLPGGDGEGSGAGVVEHLAPRTTDSTGAVAATSDAGASLAPALPGSASPTTSSPRGGVTPVAQESRQVAQGEERVEEDVGQEPDVTADADATVVVSVAVNADADAEVQAESESEPPTQVPYQPQSAGTPVGTLVPANMRTATAKALGRLVKTVGSLDDYVARQLAFDSVTQLHDHLSAEQVDAVALAIHNINSGKGFIIGDQTGIGKGRVVASLMKYALESGRIPLFVTQNPPLYADMMRDLADIGLPGFRPLVTNENLDLPLPNGQRLKTGSGTHRQELEQLVQAGNLGDYDGIFTTYNQLQTIKNKEPFRRKFLRAFIEDCLLILDEAHEAGGSIQSDKPRPSNGVKNRAEFTRELVREAQGVLYSSATYAKHPGVMDLYARTDMGLAVGKKLEYLVAEGGVPLQQALAAMLTEAGQYMRRERSYEGVQFAPQVVSTNHQMADAVAAVMHRIMVFDQLKMEQVKAMDQELKEQAKQIHGSTATGNAGLSSTNFTSIVHNLIAQMLLTMKAEATVQEAMRLLQAGEKPVIALSSTMGSFIGQYADAEGLVPGRSLDLDFGDLLMRYLERSRDVTEGNAYGEKKRRWLTDDDLGSKAVALYGRIAREIRAIDFSALPISPIDHMRCRLEAEGYRFAEVTGREHIVHYDAHGGITYQRRSTYDRSKKAAVKNVAAFNGGKVDVILLNQSGSTGISLHASAKFADQRPRHMLVVQPSANINTFMQMLGRIHRTGQVELPRFTLLMADLPAEKRPGAVLMRKLASLNANTTAARSSGFAMGDVPDFMNAYGNVVVTELMAQYPSMHERLGEPLGVDADLSKGVEKVTGRIPLLPISEQQLLYDLIETTYRDMVQRQEALGESTLEAQNLDLDARTLKRIEVIPGNRGLSPDSPFTQPVYLELVDIKTPRKPLTQLQVLNVVRQNLGLPLIQSLDAHDTQDYHEQANGLAGRMVAELETSLAMYRRDKSATATVAERQAMMTRTSEQFQTVKGLLDEFPLGTTMKIASNQEGSLYYGVVGRVWQTSQETGSPAALSRWRMQLLLADPVRELVIPFSKVSSYDSGLHLATAQQDWFGDDVLTGFDREQHHGREERYVFTGNILKAADEFFGHVVNFTDYRGRLRQGLLTSRKFEPTRTLAERPLAIPGADNVLAFLRTVGALRTDDGKLTLELMASGSLQLVTAKSRAEGGRYFLDEELLALAGSEFVSIADRMECTVEPERVEAVVAFLVTVRGYRFKAFENLDGAREFLGIGLPDLEDDAALVDEADELDDESVLELSATEVLEAVEAVQVRPVKSDGDEVARAQGDDSPIEKGLSATKAADSDLTVDALLDESEPESEPSEVTQPSELPTTRSPAPIEEPDSDSGSLSLGEVVTRSANESRQVTPPEASDSSPTPGVIDSGEGGKSGRGGVTRVTHESRQARTKTPKVTTVLKPIDQTGVPEQRVALLLQEAQLLQDVWQQPEFCCSLENPPYLALQIERQGQMLLFTHYREMAGDWVIDAEMVYELLSSGQLQLQSTATTDGSGLYRACDRQFAALFAQNLLQQGFGRSRQITEPELSTGRMGTDGEQLTLALSLAPASVSRSEQRSLESPLLRKLRQWYRAAQVMGRDVLRQEYIVQLGQTTKAALATGQQPPTLSPVALAEMQHDLRVFDDYQQFGDYVYRAALFILSCRGQVDRRTGARWFRGQVYGLYHLPPRLQVQRGQPPQCILDVQGVTVTHCAVDAQDVQRFQAFVKRLEREGKRR